MVRRPCWTKTAFFGAIFQRRILRFDQNRRCSFFGSLEATISLETEESLFLLWTVMRFQFGEVSTCGQSSCNQLCAPAANFSSELRRAVFVLFWDNQSSSLCDSDPECGGSWPYRGWAVGRDHLWVGPFFGTEVSPHPSQHTAQSPFRSRVEMGAKSPTKNFWKFFFVCSRSTDVGARREGCGRLLLLGVGLIFSWYSEIRWLLSAFSTTGEVLIRAARPC